MKMKTFFQNNPQMNNDVCLSLSSAHEERSQMLIHHPRSSLDYMKTHQDAYIVKSSPPSPSLPLTSTLRTLSKSKNAIERFKYSRYCPHEKEKRHPSLSYCVKTELKPSLSSKDFTDLSTPFSQWPIFNLEYPTTGYCEPFGLAISYEYNEYNPIYDILDTFLIISKEYHLPTQELILKCMKKLEETSFRNKSELDHLILLIKKKLLLIQEKILSSMTLWKYAKQLLISRDPSSELIHHILEQSYLRSMDDNPKKLNRVSIQSGKSYLYGELKPKLIDDIIQRCFHQPNFILSNKENENPSSSSSSLYLSQFSSSSSSSFIIECENYKEENKSQKGKLGNNTYLFKSNIKKNTQIGRSSIFNSHRWTLRQEDANSTKNRSPREYLINQKNGENKNHDDHDYASLNNINIKSDDDKSFENPDNGTRSKKKLFIDFGSGIGNVCLQVAAMTTARVIGVEIMTMPWKLSVIWKEEFIYRLGKIYGFQSIAARLSQSNQISLLRDNFLTCPITLSLLHEADVILVNNATFSSSINQQLLDLFLSCKEGCKIVSLVNFAPLKRKLSKYHIFRLQNIFQVEKVPFPADSVSWTAAPGYYFIHTVDRKTLHEASIA